MTRLKQSVTEAISEADPNQPLKVFEAIGRGYLRWALSNTTYFQIISSRTLIDFSGSESLVRDNTQIRTLMVDVLTQARDLGQLRDGVDLDHLILGARAMVYGLARMAVDGHFPEWHVSEPAQDAVFTALSNFIATLKKADAKPPRKQAFTADR